MTTKKTPAKTTSAKKAPSKKQIVEAVPKKIQALKQKVKKFRLVSYTMKATIPTGQYANIQPEVTVEAASIEAAERAVMLYFETLFAKYRDGGVKPIVPITPAPVAPVAPKPVAPVLPKVEDNKVNVPGVVPTTTTAPVASQTANGNPGPTAPVVPAGNPNPAIVMNAPFNKAKSAIDSCTSHEALKLVAEQVEKSTKLIDTEKVELKNLITVKYNDITISKTA